MVPFSQIDEKLSIYQDKKVIILGDREKSEDVKELLCQFKVEKVEVSGIFSEKQIGNFLEEITHRDEKILLQLALSEKEEKSLKNSPEFVSFSEKINDFDIVSLGEAQTIFGFLQKVEKIQENPQILQEMQTFSVKAQRKNFLNLQQYMDESTDRTPLLLCLPTKTGDHSLMQTFQKHDISYYFMHHSPEAFQKEGYVSQFEKIKVITAVRDPFSKIFSMIFDEIKQLDKSYYLWDCDLTELPHSFMKNGGDVQYLFDQQGASHFFHMPLFFQRFQKNFLNLLKYPFDQEKGYALIKEGNIEVFVYQLEKLNHLLPELSDFVGCPISELSLGNQTAGLWCAEAYERAKKDVVISPEYFENTYSELWLAHFYSDEDIEKFKSIWQNNVKE